MVTVMTSNDGKDVVNLADIAHDVMIARGFIPDFPDAVNREVASIQSPEVPNSKSAIRDMRDRLWISIDNDDSKDLDQLTLAEEIGSGKSKIFVAVADVDGLVSYGSAIDQYAAHNTTSVYTPTKIFPMLPPKLSTDLTSLNENADRCAIVIEMTIQRDGQFDLSDIYSAWVNNHAKLAYNSVAEWLEKDGPLPHPEGELPGIADQLRLQERIAKRIKEYRDRQGALTFGKIELQPIIYNNVPIGLKEIVRNRANALIENYMIAANVGMTRYFVESQLPTLRRVVRTPKRWDRIVALAAGLGTKLPSQPDSKALRDFLLKQHRADPEHFSDLSLAIIKLIGKGEYVVGLPGKPSLGHFDLALQDYAHTTAPNRRYPDLIMQRLLKSHLNRIAAPYRDDDLAELARHCTEKEDDAAKVERRMQKSAAAMVLAPQIGHRFAAMVTGVNDNGTWVRLFNPPLEGKLSQGFKGIDVGDRLTVQLTHVDVANGYIDFKRIH